MKKKQENNNKVLHIIPESLGKKSVNFPGWKGRGHVPLCSSFQSYLKRSLSFRCSGSESLHHPLGEFPSKVTDADALPSKGCLKPHVLQQHTFPICLLCSEGRAVPTACLPAGTEGKFEIKFTHGVLTNAHTCACVHMNNPLSKPNDSQRQYGPHPQTPVLTISVF